MKRYAVLRDNQLLFNETEKWFDKKTDKWIEQSERGTVDKFEEKYNLKLEWRTEQTTKTDGSIFEFEGYFIAR